jgi:hypothetical protein
MLQGSAEQNENNEGEPTEPTTYRSTAQQLQARYAETLAAIQMQQQQ